MGKNEPQIITTPPGKEKVLFVCVKNSARSQMAEAWLHHISRGGLEVKSAGFEPGTLNPLAVKVMAEAGIDISHNRTKSVFDLNKEGELFAYVITVCDKEAAERCPIFTGVTKRQHWNIPDPAVVTGTEEEKLDKVREILDIIRDRVERFYKEITNKQHVNV